MPNATALAHQKFIDDYKNFLSYTSYLQQWASQVNALGLALQSNALFSTVFSAGEQANITAITTGAGNAASALANVQTKLP